MKIIIYLVIAYFLYDLVAKKKVATVQITKSVGDVKKGLADVLLRYGRNIAELVEKIARHESAHFTSQGYKLTNGFGMEAVAKAYPYGWTTPKKAIWDKNSELKPIGLHNMIDSGNRNVDFIKFKKPSHALLAMASMVDKYGAGRWFSIKPDLQAQYVKKLAKVKTPITNAIV
jgi:hypothetical protein